MSRLDRLMFEEYRPAAAGVPFHRVFFGAWLLLGVLPRFGWIGEFSDAFFYPPLGPALLFEGFPPAWFFHALHYAVIVAALCLVAGVRVKLASFAIAAAFLTGNLWAYSFGKINHDALIIAVPAVLAFSGWEARPDTSRDERRPGWPLALLALLIALAMFTAALPKLLSGWLDPGAPATLGHVLRNHYVAERETFLSALLVQVGSPPFWKLLDYSTLAIESGFLVAMFSLRLFRLTCAVACLFHLGIWLAMDIAFTQNVVAYAAFVNWAFLVRAVGAEPLWARFDRLTARVALPHLLVAGVPLVALYAWAGNPIANWVNRGLLLVGVAFASAYLLYTARELLQGKRAS